MKLFLSKKTLELVSKISIGFDDSSKDWRLAARDADRLEKELQGFMKNPEVSNLKWLRDRILYPVLNASTWRCSPDHVKEAVTIFNRILNENSGIKEVKAIQPL